MRIVHGIAQSFGISQLFSCRGFHAWLTFLQNDKPNSAHEQPQAVPGTQEFTLKGPGSVGGDGPGDAAWAAENFAITPATASRYWTFARAWLINAIDGKNE